MYKRYLSIPTYILTGTHRAIQYLHIHTIHIHIMELDLIVAFYFSISKKYKKKQNRIQFYVTSIDFTDLGVFR